MRMITQANYNTDELSLEVIEEIYTRLQILGLEPNDETRRQYASDRRILDRRILAGLPNVDDVDARDIEDWWRRYGAEYGLDVYDDGEAGVTLVGTNAEVADWVTRDEVV